MRTKGIGPMGLGVGKKEGCHDYDSPAKIKDAA